MMHRLLLFAIGPTAALGMTLAVGTAAVAAEPRRAVRVSVAARGGQADRPSHFACVSADGRYVAFASEATNLVPGGANGVFVRDVAAGRTELASVAADGTIGNGLSWYPSISGDGRYVAFMSRASNLVPGDTNGADDVFVRDRWSGHTERVSVADDGTELGSYSMYSSISGDGRYVAFVTGSNSGYGDVLVRDRTAGRTILVTVGFDGTPANFVSEAPAISTSGRYVTYASGASNLVPGDTNNAEDIFVRDLVAGQTRRVSVGPDGESNAYAFLPAISGDGRYVTFTSGATNLTPESRGSQTLNLFVRDLARLTTTMVSTARDGTPGNDASFTSAMDRSGRYIVYATMATNLVASDTSVHEEILVYDQLTRHTRLVPVGLRGAWPDGASTSASISADGRRIAFESEASNLIPGDTNHMNDVFITTLAH